MEKIELELDEKTLEKAHWMAKWHHCTLNELIAKAIEQFAVAEAPNYPLLGGWEDEAELVDEIMEEIMQNRAAHPLNQKFGQGTT